MGNNQNISNTSQESQKSVVQICDAVMWKVRTTDLYN